MSNETVFRFLTIGTSVFIALATFSAVIMYYNTAKEAVSNLTATDIASNYNDNIKNILYKEEITGEEVKTILRYFFEDRDVSVKIQDYYAFDIDNGYVTVFITESNRTNFNWNYNSEYEELMKNIIPNQKFDTDLTYDESNNILYLELDSQVI